MPPRNLLAPGLLAELQTAGNSDRGSPPLQRHKVWPRSFSCLVAGLGLVLIKGGFILVLLGEAQLGTGAGG